MNSRSTSSSDDRYFGTTQKELERLIGKFAWDFCRQFRLPVEDHLEDLMIEGWIGAEHARTRYQDQGYSFLTFAFWHVRHPMMSYAKREGGHAAYREDYAMCSDENGEAPDDFFGVAYEQGFVEVEESDSALVEIVRSTEGGELVVLKSLGYSQKEIDALYGEDSKKARLKATKLIKAELAHLTDENEGTDLALSA